MAGVEPDTYLDITRPLGEFRIPIYQAVPEQDFSNDPQDWVVFGQGIGEIGRVQKGIIQELSSLLNRRVVGYESRLGAQIVDPWNDAVEVARSTHLRVADSVGLGKERHSIVGHSLFGLVAGALLEKGADQFRALTLVTPATVSSHAIVSEVWRDKMLTMPFSERPKVARQNEKHWRRHGLALTLGFSGVGTMVEAVRGIRNPVRAVRTAGTLMEDIKPGLRTAFSSFALLANVSSVPELAAANENGTDVNIIAANQDPVFRLTKMVRALSGTALLDRLWVMHEGKGQGHSNMATLSGESQLKKAAEVHEASLTRQRTSYNFSNDR